MHCLITGGAGFIGSHLAETLLADNHRVTVVDNLSTGSFSNLSGVSQNPALRLIFGSVLECDLIEPLVREADVVFHLASAVGVKMIMEKPVETIETTFHGTDVVLRYASRYRKKVVFTSSSEVYGKSENVPFCEDGDRLEGPTTLHRWAYACTKALDEFLVLAHYKTSGLPVVVVRLFNTVGPRQSSQYGMVIPRFVEAALQGQPLLVYGDGSQSRCFCHVADVVRALDAVAVEAKCVGNVINIGNAEEVTIDDLARRVIKATASPSKIQHVPYEQAFPGGGFEDMRRRVPSLERIREWTGWRPLKTLDEIIRDVAEDRRRYLGMPDGKGSPA
jgi:UDP-glucose 4-epimerase